MSAPTGPFFDPEAGWPGARRVVTAAEMRDADAWTIDTLGVPGVALMECAGRAVARVVAAQARPGGRVAVVCGGGNNGGDGFVIARLLDAWGWDVDVLRGRAVGDYAGDAATNLRAAERLKLNMLPADDDAAIARLPAPGTYGVVVDAVLGTGLSGEVRGAARGLIGWINAQGAPAVAVDIASGLCGETGRVLGAAVRATHTVTLGASKLGHWQGDGPEYGGRLIVADIGINGPALERAGDRWLLCDADVAPAFAPRARDAHKGTFGHVGVLGGSPGRLGAVRMSADAALRAGAGLVSIAAAPETLGPLSGAVYEVMVEALGPETPAEEAARRLNARDALVIGPGMDASEAAGDWLAALLPRLRRPVVVDADGLNHLARRPEAWKGGPPRVVTPHPGEAGRLLGSSTAAVQDDRVGAARALAERLEAVVVLKGAHSLVATPDGWLGICPAGNPGMATAGAGDVLAGVVGALLARGLPPARAAAAAVLWHARAGDHALAEGGPNGLRARDILTALSAVERGSTCCDA